MMQIEVGKSYRTRDGRKVEIERHAGVPFNYPFMGRISGHVYADAWSPEGDFRKGEEHPLDLISPWDQPSSNIAERKMDVNESFYEGQYVEAIVRGQLGKIDVPNNRARVDNIGGGWMWASLTDIQSAELPPAVGDHFFYSDERMPVDGLEILGIEGSDYWHRSIFDGETRISRLDELRNRPGFRIVKRKGE